jgi:hypothetical protein
MLLFVGYRHDCTAAGRARYQLIKFPFDIYFLQATMCWPLAFVALLRIDLGKCVFETQRAAAASRGASATNWAIPIPSHSHQISIEDKFKRIRQCCGSILMYPNPVSMTKLKNLQKCLKQLCRKKYAVYFFLRPPKRTSKHEISSLFSIFADHVCPLDPDAKHRNKMLKLRSWTDSF